MKSTQSPSSCKCRSVAISGGEKRLLVWAQAVQLTLQLEGAIEQARAAGVLDSVAAASATECLLLVRNDLLAGNSVTE